MGKIGFPSFTISTYAEYQFRISSTADDYIYKNRKSTHRMLKNLRWRRLFLQ